ncbi:transposase [Thermopirellula anaerolimosa]
MQYWLLTWTVYGTWLPGDPRGSVASVRRGPGSRRERDRYGEPFEPPMPGLQATSARNQAFSTAALQPDLARPLLEQFRQTAYVRGWRLEAAAIMADHVHVVVGISDDCRPADALRDFKAYGSRELNARTETVRRWWTRRGSQRLLRDERAVEDAVNYVLRQKRPLLVWVKGQDTGEPPA